jgi:hypothetical protein
VTRSRSHAALATKRPVVVIQSDDWGRVGIPSIEALDRVKTGGAKGGAWDRYGLESASDLEALGEMLAGIADADGNAPCVTANFVMANADLVRMRAERYADFRWTGLADGFPEPWREDVLPAYRDLIRRGLFEAALHGFTHFNTEIMAGALREESDRGRRARLLADNDIPYLASLTPEYNFALVRRDAGEQFMDESYQAEWVATGVGLFTDVFGHGPVTTCAPGYRANAVTQSLWRNAGIESFQVVGTDPLSTVNGMIQVARNVAFEPALDDGDVVDTALNQARRAVRRGTPIVICSHSINYITRFTDAAGNGRQLLHRLLSMLLEEFPQLRFANTKSLVDAWRSADAGWFAELSFTQRLRRGLA